MQAILADKVKLFKQTLQKQKLPLNNNLIHDLDSQLQRFATELQGKINMQLQYFYTKTSAAVSIDLRKIREYLERLQEHENQNNKLELYKTLLSNLVKDLMFLDISPAAIQRETADLVELTLQPKIVSKFTMIKSQSCKKEFTEYLSVLQQNVQLLFRICLQLTKLFALD